MLVKKAQNNKIIKLHNKSEDSDLTSKFVYIIHQDSHVYIRICIHASRSIYIYLYTAISIFVVGSTLQAYATSTKQLQPHPLQTPIFLSSKWLAIGNLRCMDDALLILLIVIH